MATALQLIVGIGASSGGGVALSQFFEALSPASDLAIVVAGDADAGLETSSSWRTAPCLVEPGCVHRVPPGMRVALEGDRLVRAGVDGAAIDRLFHSLASRGHEAAALLFSGNGADGAEGMLAVRDAGGLTMAQSPDTAAVAEMPLAAIAREAAELVLPPPEMARVLVAQQRFARRLTAPAGPIMKRLAKEAQSDLENFLRATEIGVLFLDRELRIRSFTPAVTEIYNLLPGDVGRPLAHITHCAVDMMPLPNPRELPPNAPPLEERVLTTTGRCFLRRVLPCQAGRVTDGMVVTFTDVSLLAATETALRERDERYRAAVSAAGVGTWRVDLRTGLDTRDESLNRILGLAPRETTQPADDFFARLHPDDRASSAAAWDRAIAGAGVYSTEHRVIRPDGTIRWIRDQGRVIVDAEGKPSIFTGAAADITEQKLAEQAIREGARQIRLLADAIPAQVAFVDESRRCRFANKTYAETFGFTVETILDKTIREILGETNHIAMQPRIDAALRGEPQQFELAVEVASGGLRIKDVAYIPDRDESGHVLGIYIFVLDVTERRKAEAAHRESEERYRSLVRATASLVWVTDPDGAMVRPQPDFERHTGATFSQYRGKGWLDAIHKDDRRRVREAWSRAVLSGTVFSVEARLYQQDLDAHRWVELRAAPVRRDDGTTREWVGMAVDVHELHEVRLAAEAASRAKSEFLANMSHEIRTPLTAILGYADVLSKHLRDPDDLGCVDTIRKNGRFLLEIINDVLDLSKIEAGKLEVHQERFAPDVLLAETRSLMSVRAAEKRLPLELVFEGPLPETIQSDPKRLRQILVNLVGNAIKFTERGEVRMVVAVDRDACLFRIDVIDTGIGISRKDQQRLFRPFTQIDASTMRSHGGTGLGLAISQRLAGMLGGSIQVESELGLGSTFTVTVATGPLDEVPFIEPAIELAPSSDFEFPTLPGLAARVLVVDDRREVRYLAQHFIEEAGGEVVTASNGRDAMDKIAAAEREGRPVDLVLMDMQMPVLDGYGACAELRRRGFTRPIIAMTAHAMRGDRERCIAAGCDDYVSKPLDGRVLVEVVSRNLMQAVTIRPRDSVPLAPARRILFVDDSEDICLVQSLLLERRGYEVITARSGREALEVARSHRPEILILDINLPDMSGIDLAGRLHALPELGDSLFIAVSGHDDEHQIAAAKNGGFHHYLVKPATIDDIEALF